MTGAQVHEARKLLGWSADRLGARCDIASATILRFERNGTMSPPRRYSTAFLLDIDRSAVLRATLEQAGVMFTEGEEPGVELRKV